MNVSDRLRPIDPESNVPIRMIVFGSFASIVLAILGALGNPIVPTIGYVAVGTAMTFLIIDGASQLRIWVGLAAGLALGIFGWRFTISQRVWPALSDVESLADGDVLLAICIGFATLAVGLGCLLESLRAATES